MFRLLDIESWSRKDHFNFFKNFEEPFFGVTVEMEVTHAYDFCKKNNQSFFLFYLFCSLSAANEVENFKYRIKEGQVLIYERIDASSTINRPDGTFGFSYIKYAPTFEEFIPIAKKEIDRVQHSQGLVPSAEGENVIHYSSLPWLKFTALSHARQYSFPDSCPKISFGKMTTSGEKRFMPVSIHVHHALVDGLHVGDYVRLFQALLNGLT